MKKTKKTVVLSTEKPIAVSAWMSKPVIVTRVTDTVGHARRIMAERRINQMPVVDNGMLVGIVTDRDIRDAYPTSLVIDRSREIDNFAETYTVEEVMSHNVITVYPSTPLASAVRLLRRHRVGSLPVVHDGRLVGIITRSKILDFVLSGGSLAPTPAQKGRRKRPVLKVSRRAS